jgi:DNA-binding CsgD family transcriptional regulator
MGAGGLKSAYVAGERTAATSGADAMRSLTRSERRVLGLLAQGLAPKQAAWELHVAISTVRSHIAAAKRKTGARTLQQLVGEFAATAAPQADAGFAIHAVTAEMCS